MPTLDPAILHALSLPSSTTYTLTAHGSSSFTTTSKLTIQSTPPKSYFLKTSSASNASTMFSSEYESLLAISQTPRLTATPISHGKLKEKKGHYLLTEFLHLTSRTASPGAPSLAKKLAQMHSTPSPDGMFGFPVSTCCGSTMQDNTPTALWTEFFAQRRIGGMLKACEEAGELDAELRKLGKRVQEEVVPRLLDPLEDVKPVLVHGDLWSGNKGRAEFEDGAVEEVVFDPSCSYAHREFEAGIMQMFEGFGGGFWEEYWKEVGGVEEPKEEAPDRRKLYELYHHLNHTALFGGGYKEGAKGIMHELVKKYGKDGTKWER